MRLCKPALAVPWLSTCPPLVPRQGGRNTALLESSGRYPMIQCLLQTALPSNVRKARAQQRARIAAPPAFGGRPAACLPCLRTPASDEPAVEDWASETQTYVLSYGFL